MTGIGLSDRAKTDLEWILLGGRRLGLRLEYGLATR